MSVSYRDPAVARIGDQITALIEGEASDADAIAIERALIEIAAANNPAVAAYFRRTGGDVGVPDAAFRGRSLFHFADAEVARAFRTSGTSGASRGVAEYSQRGLELMRRSIVKNAGQHLFQGLDRPAVIRLVPDPKTAPESIMAYGMGVISEAFGDPGASACVIGPSGLDREALSRALDRAVAEGRPAVLIGGSFAFVNLCDALAAAGRTWALPPGSRMVDAGGFKGRSRVVDVDALRANVQAVFGIDRGRCVNLFGMTELASQLYDGADKPIGPDGERPKPPQRFVRARVRDPFTWSEAREGPGLLEVTDLCVLDRPCRILTGDWAIASELGAAITGRIVASESRGCALSFESPAALFPSEAPAQGPR